MLLPDNQGRYFLDLQVHPDKVIVDDEGAFFVHDGKLREHFQEYGHQQVVRLVDLQLVHI